MIHFPRFKITVAIEPIYGPVTSFMRKWSPHPEYVECLFLVGAGSPGTWYGASLRSLENMYGPATWVCPD
jgi:hypothetical protein